MRSLIYFQHRLESMYFRWHCVPPSLCYTNYLTESLEYATAEGPGVAGDREQPLSWNPHVVRMLHSNVQNQMQLHVYCAPTHPLINRPEPFGDEVDDL